MGDVSYGQVHSDVRAAGLLVIFGNVRNLSRGIIVAYCTLLRLLVLEFSEWQGLSVSGLFIGLR